MATPENIPHLAELPDILLVDDDPGIIQTLNRILRDAGRIRFASNGSDALRLMELEVPDLILLDSEMAGMSGSEVLATIKANHHLADVPVIFVTSTTDEEFEQACLEAGAADFVTKPVRPAIVLARVNTQLRLKRMTDQLKQLASTDGLTGVANRRSFDHALSREWAVALRIRRTLALLMIDIDSFKKYNDHYGHLEGDSCLVTVARAIADALRRPADLAFRYGGEEFAVLLPDTDIKGAEKVAGLVLDVVNGLAIPHALSDCSDLVTVSLGVAAFDPRDCSDSATSNVSPETLITTCDAALYEAKRAGRAQFRLATTLTPGRRSDGAENSADDSRKLEGAGSAVRRVGA